MVGFRIPSHLNGLTGGGGAEIPSKGSTDIESEGGVWKGGGSQYRHFLIKIIC